MAEIIVNADQGKNRINRHIYGHFSEHLGQCIYDGYWVGEESPIPNLRGIRTDIVEALKKIRVPNIRWPGGCFADEYHWKDGIGPREDRPSLVNMHWGGVTENNHFGTHEFMDLCDQIGCEPYICGNVGSGSVQEMREWVEYLTMDTRGPMADLRRANGREKPWKVKFWGVGNENWGCGGQMRPEYYADLYRRYSLYCRDFGDSTLYKIACGPNRDCYQWTEVLMREAGGPNPRGRFMDGLSLHFYTSIQDAEGKRAATGFDEADWFKYLERCLTMEELVTRHGTIMDRYDPEKRVGLVVDEWGTWHNVERGTHPRFLYQQNTVRDALVAGLTLNIFNRHCERVRVANLAQTVNVLQALILTDREKMILTPTYHVFDMYKRHQDAVLLPIGYRTGEYSYNGDSIPEMSSSASKSDDGTINLSLCHLNPHDSLDTAIEIRGATVKQVAGQIVTGERMDSHNTFDNPDQVTVNSFSQMKLDGNRFTVTVPSKSVVMLKIR
jgi:alpha-N-arabinofuranosidase